MLYIYIYINYKQNQIICVSEKSLLNYNYSNREISLSQVSTQLLILTKIKRIYKILT